MAAYCTCAYTYNYCVISQGSLTENTLHLWTQLGNSSPVIAHIQLQTRTGRSPLGDLEQSFGMHDNERSKKDEQNQNILRLVCSTLRKVNSRTYRVNLAVDSHRDVVCNKLLVFFLFACHRAVPIPYV